MASENQPDVSGSVGSTDSYVSATFDPWHTSGRFQAGLIDVDRSLIEIQQNPGLRNLDRARYIPTYNTLGTPDQNAFPPLTGINTLAKAKEAYKEVIDAPLTLDEWVSVSDRIRYSPGLRYYEEAKYERARISHWLHSDEATHRTKGTFLGTRMGSIGLDIVIRHFIRTRWESLGLWDPTWGCPGGPERSYANDPTFWFWPWDKHARLRGTQTGGGSQPNDMEDYFDRDAIAAMINLRLEQRRGEPIFYELKEHTTKHSSLGERMEYLISRPWMHFNMDRISEEVRIKQRILQQQPNLRRVLVIDDDEIRDWMKDYGDWEEEWSEKKLIGWTWPGEPGLNINEDLEMERLNDMTLAWDLCEVSLLSACGLIESGKREALMKKAVERARTLDEMELFTFDQPLSSRNYLDHLVSPKTHHPTVNNPMIEPYPGYTWSGGSTPVSPADSEITMNLVVRKDLYYEDDTDDENLEGNTNNSGQDINNTTHNNARQGRVEFDQGASLPPRNDGRSRNRLRSPPPPSRSRRVIDESDYEDEEADEIVQPESFISPLHIAAKDRIEEMDFLAAYASYTNRNRNNRQTQPKSESIITNTDTEVEKDAGTSNLDEGPGPLRTTVKSPKKGLRKTGKFFFIDFLVRVKNMLMF
ncbi:hypothetical protein BROUX41_002439 [Berkeleyomyces rouxiae]